VEKLELFARIQNINKDKVRTMPRILGIDIPKEKRIEASLPYIFGIGPARAKDVLTKANIDCNRRAKDLSDEEVARITAIIQSDYIVEGDLRREISQNVKRLVDIGSYRGSRHRKGLPARGQRTRTNSRTRKGRKATVGGVKPKAE
jgi:small subunit ribosomal protein S13